MNFDSSDFTLRPLTFCHRQKYTWRGFRQTRGIRRKARRVISQFSPADWTTFHWEGTADFTHYITVVLLLALFLAAELNPFYLKVRLARFRSWFGP